MCEQNGASVGNAIYGGTMGMLLVPTTIVGLSFLGGVVGLTFGAIAAKGHQSAEICGLGAAVGGLSALLSTVSIVNGIATVVAIASTLIVGGRTIK